MADPRAVIHEFLAEQREEATRFLAELVRIPSDNPPGDCAPHATRAALLLEHFGFKVERHAVPEAQVRENGMASCVNLIARERFGAGPTIACNAHGDVVPPGEGWTTDPYGAQIRDGRMFGRGVAVSKSDFATYAFALLALKAASAAGAKLSGAVELHFTYDEEVGGGIGPAWLLAQRLSRPDYAISAGFSYAITTAHNGCLHLEVEVRGKSGHAAEPRKGVDALEAATAMLDDLYALRRGYASIRSSTSGITSPTLVIGLIEGGINTNVVPDRVVFRLDRRIIPEEDAGEVESALTMARRDDRGSACATRAPVRSDRGPGEAGHGDPEQCESSARREHRDARHADLHRRSALQRRGHSHGALRRRPAHARRGERASR